MSDYFGALMNLSGLAGTPRSAAAEPAPGNDIVESDVMRETPAGPAFLPPRRPPAASGTTAGEAAVAPAAQVDDSLAQATAASETLRPLPPHTEFGPARSIALVTGAPAATPAAIATTPDVRDHTIARAALEWIAADPQTVSGPAFASVLGQTPTLESSLAAPPTREERAPIVVEEASLATTRTSLRADAVPLVAQVVRMEPPGPDRSAAHSAPAADEIIEISIGAIHVRVDAPAPQTVARAAPAAVPASPTPSLSERAAGRSALARRALRRI